LITIENSRTGLPVLKKDDRFLASSVDPLREAQTWAAKVLAGVDLQESIIVLGLGSGYHVSALKEFSPRSEVIVIENDPEVIQQVLSILPQLRALTVICIPDWTKLNENRVFCDAVGGLYRVAPYAPSCQIEKSYFRAVTALLLGRDKLAFLYLVKARPELLGLLHPASLTEIQDENISIKTLQKLFSPTSLASRERRVWRVLEELIV
jgi:hypothetical protein